MTTATVLLLFARICIVIAMQSTSLLPLTLNIRGGSLVYRDSPSSSPRKPNVQCQESSSVNDAREYIAPNVYDVMLLDVNHTILVKKVAVILEVKYLGPAQNVLRFPLHGILFGNNRRVMVNFSCRRCSLGKIYPWLNIICPICADGNVCNSGRSYCGRRRRLPASRWGKSICLRDPYRGRTSSTVTHKELSKPKTIMPPHSMRRSCNR